MIKYLVEFIGTFFLVLTIGLVVIQPGAGEFAPLAIGSVLMVMIYAGGPVSGAHYNPAVTFGVWLRGKCPTPDVPGYLAAQIAGAVLAGFLVPMLTIDSAIVAADRDLFPTLLAELLFTFALVYVVLNVATTQAAEGNSYFGLAIGFTVMAGAFSVGNISGGAFNPAVVIGAVVMGIAKASHVWIYLIANLGGAALAVLAFRAIHPHEHSVRSAAPTTTEKQHSHSH